MENSLIAIENMVYEIRGQKVMLDSDLASLYEIETSALNRAVKRNIERFPEIFMFQLTESEQESLRCQFGISKEGKGGRRYLPYVFTEHGVLMLSSVLNSKKAIEVNIEIMKVFVKMRHLALSNENLSEKIENLKKVLYLHIDYSQDKFSEHDKKIDDIITALNFFTEQPREPKKIGFKNDKD